MVTHQRFFKFSNLHITKSFIMDNKKYITTNDRIRVNAHDPSEVEYLHSKFPELSHAVIKQAIVKAGPVRQNIVKYLRTKMFEV